MGQARGAVIYPLGPDMGPFTTLDLHRVEEVPGAANALSKAWNGVGPVFFYPGPEKGRRVCRVPGKRASGWVSALLPAGHLGSHWALVYL